MEILECFSLNNMLKVKWVISRKLQVPFGIKV